MMFQDRGGQTWPEGKFQWSAEEAIQHRNSLLRFCWEVFSRIFVFMRHVLGSEACVRRGSRVTVQYTQARSTTPQSTSKGWRPQQGSSRGTRSRSGTCLSHKKLCNTCSTELQYVLHTVPSDEAARGPISRRSQAGLQTVSTGAAVLSHSVSGAIMHNFTSNTNQLGSPPRNAHCRLLYWRSICHMAASVTQPHPRP
jgi:hypothetical protein